ncbi:MAG TPA: UDP-glucose 4-epimerase GalE [Acidimicrobiales bacterium]|jgi:UDP-glucose-4-epimerase GalE|nr:UDP-glucose 4-epimerase GalE [Acidimicrobiales bacterium]
MPVLVTGGAGYIGSHTVRQLRQSGEPVAVLDNLEFGHRDAVVDTPLVVGDIADADLVADTIGRYHIDAIIHFAAYKAAGESFENPGRYFKNNVAGTAQLLESAHRNGVRHFVFSSTCAVYGTAETIPVSETAPIQPESPYGESKALVERMLHWYDRSHGMRSVSLRYFNAAGAAMDGSLGEDWSASLNLVPLAMKALLDQSPPLRVFGTDYPTEDGTAVRDYIHVDDLADAHLKALDYLRHSGKSVAVNLGTGVGSTVRQVLAAAERAAGRPVPAQDHPRRPGDPVALFADNSRARDLLGWEPRYGLDEIVTSAWQWHSMMVV